MTYKNIFGAFDGMSCGQIALNNLGISYENYFASEVDKYAMEITQKNFPRTKQVGDITKISASDFPLIDLYMGGSPCQSFSVAGDGTGFNGKSGLFWDYIKLFRDFQKINPNLKFLLENVKMKKEWENIITKAIGVEPISINSRNFGAQNRERLFWTNIPIVKEMPTSDLVLRDILTTDFSEKTVKDTARNLRHERSLDQKSLTCTATMYKGAGNNGMTLVRRPKQKELSVLNVNEVERLMNVSENHTEGVSNTQRYKMLGNGWDIKVIEHIFCGL